VKVTGIPAQIVVDVAFTLTEGDTVALTDIVIAPDVAGLPVTQVAFDVITQDT